MRIVVRMPNRTIYVPDDLDSRMRKLKDQNWSEIACQAFIAKVGEIAQQKKGKDMQDVIDRLRASKQQGASKEYAKGAEAGRTWAKNEAEAEALERLHWLTNAGGPADPAWNNIDPQLNNFTVAEQAERWIRGKDEDTDEHESAEFWEAQVGHTEPSDEMVTGFVEGALEVWNMVKGKL